MFSKLFYTWYQIPRYPSTIRWNRTFQTFWTPSPKRWIAKEKRMPSCHVRAPLQQSSQVAYINTYASIQRHIETQAKYFIHRWFLFHSIYSVTFDIDVAEYSYELAHPIVYWISNILKLYMKKFTKRLITNHFGLNVFLELVKNIMV